MGAARARRRAGRGAGGAEVEVAIPTLAGRSLPVRVRLSAEELEEARRDPEIHLALAAVKVPGAAKLADYWVLDETVKRAYRRSPLVRRLVWKKALAKVGGDEETARAYVSAWLKAAGFELPPEDPDAELVSRQYYKLVWRMGGRKYVLQDAPWM